MAILRMGGIVRRKDRTDLVATRRLLVSHVYERRGSGAGGEPSPLYIQLYLWRTLEAMRANSAASTGLACHSPTPVRIAVYADGSEAPAVRRLMSEIHFAAGWWHEEVVSHELTHALLEAERSDAGGRGFSELVDSPFAFEEEWCYRFGRWYGDVFRWLWKWDPPSA